MMRRTGWIEPTLAGIAGNVTSIDAASSDSKARASRSARSSSKRASIAATASLIALPASGRCWRRQRADRAPDLRHLAVAAEIRDAHVLERLLVDRRSLASPANRCCSSRRLVCQFRHRSSKAKRPVRSTLPGASKTAVTSPRGRDF